MLSKLEKLPPELRCGILRYYYRRRACKAVCVFLSCMVLYLAVVWIAIHVDRFSFLTLEERQRLVVAVHGLIGLIASIRLLPLLLRKCPAKEIAYAIEAGLGPSLQERYSTLVDVLNRDESDLSAGEKEFIDELAAETLKLDSHHHTAGLVRYRRLLPWVFVSCLSAVCFFLPTLSEPYEFGLMLERFYQPRSAYPRPSFIRIESLPGAEVIGEGQEFVLQVKTRGNVPRIWLKLLELMGRELGGSPEMHLESRTRDDAPAEQKRELTGIGEGRYIFAQSDVRGGFRYRVRYGDAQTDWSEVEVVSIPQVTEIKLHITPPPYSRLERRTIIFEGQSFLFLKGTQVRLVFKTNQAAAERVILSDILEKPVIPIWDEETNRGAYRFVLRDKMTLRIRIKNQRGFENANPSSVSFQLLEDHPPSVLIKAEEVLRHTSATDSLALPFHVEDDYGISEISVSYIVNPVPGQKEGAEEVKLPFRDRNRKLTDVGHFDLRAAKVYPGDRILLRLRARDSAGQSGFSQGVLIDITSFGRGAREEIRIRNLRFLAKALERASESTSKGNKPESASVFISGGIYRRIIEEARANGIGISEETSFTSLFNLLGREHVLTSSSWDKEDLRRIDSVLALSTLPAVIGDDIEFRNERVVQLLDDVLLPLLDYRELKNLMWRFFGLRDAVSVLLEKPSVDSARLELVFTTLERSAARLLKVASRIRSLDSSRLRQEVKAITEIRKAILGSKESESQQGPVDGAFDDDLFTQEAGPEDVQKEPAKVRPVAAKAKLKLLSEKLSHLLSISQGGILEVLKGQKEARQALVGMYEKQLANLIASQAEGDRFHEWWRQAMEFIDRNTRLMRANPHHPLWPLVKNHVLSRSLLSIVRKLETKGKKGKTKEPEPPPTPVLLQQMPQVFQAHEKAQDELLVCSELMVLDRLEHISATEKEFAARWLLVELDERHKGATTERKEALKAMSLTKTPSAPFAFLARPESVCRSKAEYPTLERQLRTAVSEQVAPATIADEANYLLAKFQATNRVLNVKDKAQEGLALEKQVLRCLVERLYLELMALPVAADSARTLDSFYLKLREFRDRPPITLHRLSEAPGEGQLVPQIFEDVEIDLRALGRHRRTAYGKLSSIIGRFQKKETQDLDDYQRVLAEEFERTRSYVEVCTELSVAEDRTDVARRTIGDSEEATMAWLSSSLTRLHSAVALLRKAQSALKENRSASGVYRTLIDQTQQAIGRYLKTITLSQPSPFREHLTAELQNAAASIAKLKAAQTNADTAIYETENLVRKLEDLSQEVTAYSARVGKLRFTGGALDAGRGLSPARVFEAGRQLAVEVEFHRERVNVDVFELLEDNPRLPVYQMGLLHGAFLYRVVRSDLARFRPIEPILPPSGRPNYVGYLRKVLQEAGRIKIIYYRDTVPPFLGRMGQYRWKLPKKK